MADIACSITILPAFGNLILILPKEQKGIRAEFRFRRRHDALPAFLAVQHWLTGEKRTRELQLARVELLQCPRVLTMFTNLPVRTEEIRVEAFDEAHNIGANEKPTTVVNPLQSVGFQFLIRSPNRRLQTLTIQIFQIQIKNPRNQMIELFSRCCHTSPP